MGIQLDWDIDGSGDSSPQEVPEPVKKRQRRIRNSLIGAVLLLALLIASYLLRSRQVDQDIDQALETTLYAEITALRFGHETDFIDIQWDDLEWHRTQRAYYDRVQAEGWRFDDEPVSLTIDGDYAQAVIAVTREQTPVHVTWFYHFYEGQWYHIPPDLERLGPVQELATEYTRIVYYPFDAPLAEWLAPRVDATWERTCQAAALACDEQTTIYIGPAAPVDPEAAIATMQATPVTGFSAAGALAEAMGSALLPTLLSAGTTPDGQPTPPIQTYAANVVAHHWAEQIVERSPTTSTEPIHPLYDPIYHWIRADMLPDAGPTFLGEIEALYGPAAVADVIAVVDEENPLLGVRGVIQGYTTHTIDSFPEMEEATHILRAMAASHQLTDGAVGRYAFGLELGTFEEEMFFVLALSDPSSIVAQQTRRDGRIIWVQVAYTDQEGVSRVAALPFTYAYSLIGEEGRWYLTDPEDTDTRIGGTFSAGFAENRARFTTTEALDNPLIAADSDYDDEIIQGAVEQATADLGLSTGEVTIVISPLYTDVDTREVLLPLPAFLFSESPDELIAYHLLAAAIAQENPGADLIAKAIARWQMQKMDFTPPPPVDYLPPEPHPVSVLDDMWGTNVSDPDAHLAADALVEAIVEVGGADGLSNLSQTLKDATSPTGWLTALSTERTEIRSVWWAKYQARLAK